LFFAQPMDNGVIRSFETSYGRYFLQYLIESYDETKDWKVALGLVIDLMGFNKCYEDNN